MEINEGIYNIPDGYTAKIMGRTVKVYKTKKVFLEEGEYRCKDCQHYVRGHSTTGCWKTFVCNMKPKKEKYGRQRFYAAQKYGKICDDFQLK